MTAVAGATIPVEVAFPAASDSGTVEGIVAKELLPARVELASDGVRMPVDASEVGRVVAPGWPPGPSRAPAPRPRGSHYRRHHPRRVRDNHPRTMYPRNYLRR